MSLETELLLRRACDAFNARDLDTALALMQPDVAWPNGMAGGYVHGRDGVCRYWTRQWTLLDPQVTPVGFRHDGDGRTVVDVHQVVRDLNGTVLAERHLQHVYTVQDGLIAQLDIRER